MNVQDDYFDTDISCVLPQKGNIVLADILPDIQLSLRRKYGFGVKPQIYRMEGFQCFEFALS